MPKTLDEALEDVRVWKEQVAQTVAAMSPEERAAYWAGAEQACEAILGRPLKLRRHPGRRVTRHGPVTDG